MRLAQSSFFLFLSVDEESFHPIHDGSHLDPDERSGQDRGPRRILPGRGRPEEVDEDRDDEGVVVGEPLSEVRSPSEGLREHEA